MTRYRILQTKKSQGCGISNNDFSDKNQNLDSEPSYEVPDGHYEEYHQQKVPAGYTRYKQNRNPDPIPESEYDQYNPNYEQEEPSADERSKLELKFS